MRTLFDETTLNEITLKNRIVRSATWEGMADESGRPTDRLLAVYRSLAQGGVGLIITGAVLVTADRPDPLGPPSGHLRIDDDSLIAECGRLADVVHQAGCPIVMQLAYVGKNGGEQLPADVSDDEIRGMIRDFGLGALRAKEAGFDGVQIHAAHGYFLSRFLHPAKNTRQDAYGGDAARRSRALLEIYDEIRLQTGEGFAVLIKIDGTDLDLSDALAESSPYACKLLAQRGLDAVEVSGEGGAVLRKAGLPHRESVFRDYAVKMADAVDIPVMLVGLNRTPAEMEAILNSSFVDYFSLARPLIREADLVNQWRADPAKVPACVSCNRCFRTGGNTCAVVSPEPEEK